MCRRRTATPADDACADLDPTAGVFGPSCRQGACMRQRGSALAGASFERDCARVVGFCGALSLTAANNRPVIDAIT